MEYNARPHRPSAVIECLRQNAFSTIPWPAHSPDLNPNEHVWDILGRKVRAMNPLAQNLAKLEAALHREWRQIPKRQIQRLVQGMRRRVRAVINVRGGHTRYTENTNFNLPQVLSALKYSYKQFCILTYYF